jgi:transcriptional regulator with XRE-family HTH domain
LAQISFGRLIADARKARDLTQEEVAAVLGMTRANYSQIETGARKEVLSPEVATKLARLLNLDMLILHKLAASHSPPVPRAGGGSWRPPLP